MSIALIILGVIAGALAAWLMQRFREHAKWAAVTFALALAGLFVAIVWMDSTKYEALWMGGVALIGSYAVAGLALMAFNDRRGHSPA